MSVSDAFEALLVRGLRAGIATLPRPAALRVGAALGDGVRLAGIRRAVARDNLALAFPDLSDAARDHILVEHYRDLGRIVCEYARVPALVHAPPGEVIASARGLEHLDTVQREGRGAILLTGHYGHFGLLGAWLGRLNPVDFAGKPLANPHVEAILARIAEQGGVGRIRFDMGARRVFTALRQNRWVVLIADQDAGHHGVFVPFMGRPSSTWAGPAQISLRTGSPIVMSFITRREDGRHEVEVLPPLTLPDPGAPDAARALTALHAAILERWVRKHPPMWFWMHRRWKSAPPAARAEPAGEGPGERMTPAEPGVVGRA
jgi:KDO2-lipid IV(A) lauroyltransferase